MADAADAQPSGGSSVSESKCSTTAQPCCASSSPQPLLKLRPDAQAAYSQLANGPVAQNVKDQSAKTGAEFTNMKNARKAPANPAATGQPLTHYHSFFSELLSWNNPRVSAIAYATVISFIFAARYLDVIRYALRLAWMALGVTVVAEVAGKTVLNSGLATQLRPRQYYTIPRETLDSVVGDVHELINFFVIEAQRILFAENVVASAVAAVAAFVSYFLVKIVPYWGLAVIATTLLFFVPLVYTTNQELIDHHIQQASQVINTQTEQFRQVASQRTAKATDITKQYVGDYTAKAQQMMRGRSASPEATTKSAPIKESDFPEAPKEDLKSEPEPEPEPEPETKPEPPAEPEPAAASTEEKTEEPVAA